MIIVGYSYVKASAVWQTVALFLIVLVSRDASCMDVTRAPSQSTADKFTIFDTTVQCNDDFQKQQWCHIRNADNDRTHKSCKCVCRRNFLTFLPELQTCVSNRDVYSILGDCAKRTQDQMGFPPLSVVSGRRNMARFQLALVPWPSSYVLYSSTEICHVNHENSFYRVDRQWTPIKKGVFSLQRNNHLVSTKVVLKWSDNVPSIYSGRILRLDLVNCSDLWQSDVERPGGCMLLKVAGNISEIISPSQLYSTNESPTSSTDKASPLAPAAHPSNTLASPSKTETTTSVETLSLPTATTAVSFAAESGLSSAYSIATLPTKSRIAPEPSSVLPSSSPPPAERYGERTYRTFNLSLIIVIGGVAAGCLVLFIVVVILVKLCRRKWRSEEYPVKKRTRAEERNSFKTEDVLERGGAQGHADDQSRNFDLTHAKGEPEIQPDPSSKFAQRNLAYQTTDIIRGLLNLKATNEDATDSDTEDEAPYLKPSDEVHKHDTADEPTHLDEEPEYQVLEEGPSNDEAPHNILNNGHALRSPECEEATHLDPPDEEPEYQVLEEGPSNDEALHNVLDNGHALQSPNSEEPTAEQPDYDVLEGPDSSSPSQDYRFLVGKTTDTYAALRGQRKSISGTSDSQDQQVYTCLKKTANEMSYQTIQGRLAH